MPRIVQLHQFGGPQHLSVDEVPSREPGPGEARLRVQAVSVTRDQFMFLEGRQFRGTGFAQPPLPSRVGYEAAGVVDAVGEGVDEAWVGKRVAPIGPFSETQYGVMGEEAIVPAAVLSEYPDRLSPEEATAFWVPFLTAYGLLHAGHLTAGEIVSIPAAASAVGLAAIQVAADLGAVSIAVTRSAHKRDALLEAGADHVIVSTDEDYVERVRQITDGRGVRLTFEPVGGDFLALEAQAAAPGGTIVSHGILAGEPGRYPQELVLGKTLTIRGYGVGEIVRNPELLPRVSSYILDRIADGRFTPRVAEILPLEGVKEAYELIRSNRPLGRTVLATGL